MVGVLVACCLCTGFATLATPAAARADGVALVSGDILASVGDGLVDNYSGSGSLLDTLDTGTGATYDTGGCFDSSGNFYVTDFSSGTVSKFDAAGNLVASTWARTPGTPESCTVDAAGHVYVSDARGASIYEFDPSGAQANTFAVTGGSGTGGTDWLDLGSDQCTVLYTGEGAEILSYNACTQTQNADFATGLPNPCFELRIRPDGDVMVACAGAVLRYSSAGALLQTYTIPGTSQLFSMNLDPDNTTFWTGDDANGEIYHVDIATGTVITQFASSPKTGLFGLTLVGAISVSQQPTVTTSLSGGGQSGPTISVPAGTSVSDSAQLSGADSSTATGSVTYDVYSDLTCTTAVSTGTPQPITTAGTLPPSSRVTLSGTGTYYWQADYSGDSHNLASSSTCGSEVETVTGSTTQPTSVSTSLSGGGRSGGSITVPSGTAVTDSATLAGANAASATGTVTYTVYSDAACTTAVAASPAEPIATPGTLPGSPPVTLTSAARYYWTAYYSGDTANRGSQSPCGSEVETVTGNGTHRPPVVDDHCAAVGSNSATVKPGLDTTVPGDLLVAYATADGPKSGGQSLTVSGLGLTWTRVAHDNAALGDAEVWTATAPGIVTNGRVTATAHLRGYHAYLTVVAYRNATGTGAVATSAGTTGAPVATVTTTQDHSQVWGVGFDWTASKARKVGAAQELFNQTFDGAQNTDWVQTTAHATPASGTSVRLNDTAPTTDRYDFVVVEVL